MKRLIFVFFLLCSSSFAATWFANACNAANMSACDWRPTQGASCVGTGTALVWASRAAGDVFDSNGCAAINMADAVDPGANGKVTLTTDGTNTGGGFTCVTSTGPTNITANITATASGSTALAISGVSGSKCALGQNGTTVTLTGGSVASAVAVADTHSSAAGTLAHFANAVGGSNVSAVGYSSTSTGSATITGTATGATGPGYTNSNSGNLTITNCIGSDTVNTVVGCQSTSTGTITVTGNLIFGKKGPPANGTVLYVPAAATNCIMAMGAAAWATTPSVCTATDGTHQQMPSDITIKTTTNVLNGVAYGSYTGTAVTSGSNSGSAN